LAKKFHPDANPSKDAKEKFAEINKYQNLQYTVLMKHCQMKIREKYMIKLV
jgi:DnaJ-class molecular chaperone